MRKNPVGRRFFLTDFSGKIPLPSSSMNEHQQAHYHTIEAAIRFLEKNFQRQPALEKVAESVHLSPFHFQRLFTEWAGISPGRFLQFLTADFLKARLRHQPDRFDAAAARLSGPARVPELFTTLEAVTPAEYKSAGHGLVIRYGLHDTPFGTALLGATGRGICWLSFLITDADPQPEVERMKTFWSHSVFQHEQFQTHALIAQIFHGSPTHPLHVLVKGTNFQVKVWQALLQLPFGAVTTYQQLAEAINNPRALQAVGSAVGSNHVAYLIPCHRVIRKDGHLGEYRWQSARKKCIVGWELATRETFPEK